MNRNDLRRDYWRISPSFPSFTPPNTGAEFRTECDLTRTWRIVVRQGHANREGHQRARYEQALFTMAARDRHFAAQRLSVSERI